MKKQLIPLILVCLLFTSCNSKITLTDAQSQAISCVLEHKDAWQESWYNGFSKFGTTNRVYFWEQDGNIYFTYGYYEEDDSHKGMTGGGAIIGGRIKYNMEGLLVDISANSVKKTSKADNIDWLSFGTEVQLRTMSEEELKTALEDAYRKYLSKK